VRPAAWAADLTDLLLPSGCVACGIWIPGGRTAALVCGRCKSRLAQAPWPRCPRCHYPRATGRNQDSQCRECEDWPPELTFARYAHVLQTPVDDLVHALKYEGWAELAQTMAEALARITLPASGPAVVTAIPTTAARVRARGYNQAGLLAERYSAASGLPIADLLVRARATASQTELHPAERQANVEGVFAVDAPAMSHWGGAHVVLVDDVLTTGATASEAARALVSAGASGVTLIAFARALPSALR